MTTNRRFNAPVTLNDDTLVLSVAMKEWNKAFVGNFERSLVDVKNRADALSNTTSVVRVKKSAMGVGR